MEVRVLVASALRLAGLVFVAASCTLPAPHLVTATPRSIGREQEPATQPATRHDAATPVVERSWTPIQLGLVDPVQLFDRETDVRGLRLSLIAGHAHSVTGLDVNGLLGRTSVCSGGLQVSGLANVSDDCFHGLQVAGLGNWCSHTEPTSERAYGMQVALGFNVAEMDGIQIAVGNVGCRSGLQVGVVNGARDFAGLQVGAAYNEASRLDGCQVGFLNRADAGHSGLQLGVINITRSGKQLGLINCNSGGFFPVFPFFNF